MLVLVESGDRLVAEKSNSATLHDDAPFEPLSTSTSRIPLLRLLLIAVGSVCLLAVAIWFANRPSTRSVAGDTQTPGEIAAAKEQPAGSADAADKPPQRPQLTETEQRLERIGQVVKRTSQKDKAFPRGTVAGTNLPFEQRLGWLAELAEQLDPQANIPFVRDHGWQDPLNEAFVRRRLSYFQNPAVAQLTGEDGYPATHFVGVGGVGPDGPQLTTADARAGMFGFERSTRLEDVRDGLTNTMLVAGVNNHLGSWAAGGKATVRPFATEPYLGGPDGFGTGQPDVMYVLMADGRVTTITKKTDPALVRAMAAITDETLRRESQEPAEVIAHRNDQPILPEFAPDPVELEPPPKVRTVAEIETALDQPLLSFTFPATSPPLLILVREVAELTGVPVTYEPDELGPAAESLHKPIPEPKVLTLKNPKLRDVLAALLQPVGLTVQPEPGKLRLVRIDREL